MRYMQQSQPGTTPGPEVPDGVLVGQALAGDELAFATLVDRYQDLLRGYIRSMLNDGEQSSDVLQQVLLQLYLSLPTLNTHMRLKGWLFRVARNRCIDEVRQRNRRNEVCFSTLERERTEEELLLVERIAVSQQLPCSKICTTHCDGPSTSFLQSFAGLCICALGGTSALLRSDISSRCRKRQRKPTFTGLALCLALPLPRVGLPRFEGSRPTTAS